MKLYGFPGSPNTWKVRAVAAHLQQPIEFSIVDLAKGQQRTPEYLAINPTGRTPTLVDGDFKLWESTAIMMHLASLKPNSLFPDDPRTRADIARWQSWQLQHWGAQACEPLLFERIVKPYFNLGPADEAAVAKATEAFHRDARLLTDHLATRRYLVGDDITLADFSVAALLVLAKEAQMPAAAYPRMMEWFARVLALPAWQETAPLPLPAA